MTVTVSSSDDDVDESDEDVGLTFNDTSGVYSNGSATVTITDDDTAGVTVTESSGSTDVTEGGSSDAYDLVLDSEPTSQVDIEISTDSEVSTDVSTASFTSGNWDSAQTVTVSASDDSNVEGSHTGTVTQSASTSASEYTGVSVSNVVQTMTSASLGEAVLL